MHQQCPVHLNTTGRKASDEAGCRRFMGVHDLNFKRPVCGGDGVRLEHSNRMRASMRWTPPPSIYARAWSAGRRFGLRSQPAICTRCKTGASSASWAPARTPSRRWSGGPSPPRAHRHRQEGASPRCLALNLPTDIRNQGTTPIRKTRLRRSHLRCSTPHRANRDG